MKFACWKLPDNSTKADSYSVLRHCSKPNGGRSLSVRILNLMMGQLRFSYSNLNGLFSHVQNQHREYFDVTRDGNLLRSLMSFSITHNL